PDGFDPEPPSAASASVGARPFAPNARIPAAPRPARAADDDDVPAAILRAIEAGARYADEVAQALGIGLPRTNHALLLLMLSGDISQGPGGVLTRAPR